MRNVLRDYLTFTNKERNGLLVLISILVLVLIYLKLDFGSEPVDNTDMAEFASEMEALTQPANWENDRNSEGSDPSSESVANKNITKDPYVFHQFDPNYVTDDEWREMGLKTWQIKGIRNYREKAGDIRSAEQFEKLHVVTDAFFETVKGHLVFEEKHEKLSKTDSKDKVRGEEPEAILSIELNSATAGQLMDLKGIGPAFSSRIVKYRNWLGGFIRLDQLREVYGLKDSLYAEIIPFLTLQTKGIAKININKAMISSLRKHPYIKWNTANAIVNYRDQHGPYESVEDIMKTDLVSKELYSRIAPYLSVE